MAQLDTQTLKSLLDSARSVALLLPKNPSYDAVASALGLKLSLEQAGKTVTVAAPEPVTVEFNRLVGVNTITQNFGKRDLVISFPGQTEVVDKVSYNVDKGELQLVVTPKPNTPGIDPNKLKFVAGGPQADLIIFVAGSPADWEEARDLVQSAKQYSLPDGNLSQSVTQALEALQLPMSADAASNLLAGLEKASNMYQAGTTAETFEAAAVLMRHGAHRHDVYTPNEVVPGSVPQSKDDWNEPKLYQGTNLS